MNLIRSANLLALVLLMLAGRNSTGQDVQSMRDVHYKASASSEYERQRCHLDMIVPDGKAVGTLIWFHGGALENGDKADKIATEVIKRFTAAGFAVASVNYRLSPRVTFPAYIEDAAAAVTFVRDLVRRQGGDASRVFVSGHSAGGYVTAMLAVDESYLKMFNARPQDFAGFLPVSGQMITHSTVRKERGLPKTQPVIDSAAPAWHISESVPPMLCVWGDNDLPTRAEENAYFVAAMRAAKNDRIEALHVAERTHDTIASLINRPDDVVAARMEKFMRAHTALSAAKSKLRVEQTELNITVLDNSQPVIVYNKQSPTAPRGIDAIYERSGFLHPAFSPSGQVVTAAFPEDHPHQHGIFSAWVKTTYKGEAVDFWNLAGRTGYVMHERVVAITEPAQVTGDQETHEEAVGFEVDLLHRIRSQPPVDVLRESWKITVQPTDGSYRCFDLETKQQALTDEPLKIEKYHYGGVAVRGPTRWLSPNDSDRKTTQQATEPFNFVNSLGQDRLAGNHARAHWVSMNGTSEGKPVSLTVLDHPTNFRAPQAARLHPTKPYFCFSPCVDSDFEIDKMHAYRARYRFIVSDAPAAHDWLESQWEKWSKS